MAGAGKAAPGGAGLFYAAALAWLPLGIVALSALRGFAPAQLDARAWLAFAALAPAGLFLPLACRAIWRLGRRKSAGFAFVLLAPVAVLCALVGGLLGPPGILVSALAGSLPAWLGYGVLRLYGRQRSGS